MKVPFSWLKEFVDIDITPQELEEKLFGCGFEVEELIDLSAEISRVVVGEITHMEKQEGTDHLHLCRVNCGEYGEDLAITTGAPNIFVGALVPVAVGSGVVNDLTKLASGEIGIPYMVCATAASVDGYSSFGASIRSPEGAKQT